MCRAFPGFPLPNVVNIWGFGWAGTLLKTSVTLICKKKKHNRVAELVDAHPPGLVASFRYNEYVASVFLMLLYLFPDFPKAFEALEHRTVLKLLRMPGNSLTRHLSLPLNL